MRKNIRKDKKMLDIKNHFFVLLKNDFGVSLLKNIFPFLKRELALFIYFLLFEQYTLLAYPKVIAKIPRMLKKRKYIMSRAKRSREEMEKWIM
jgi:hypothetical protein